MSRPKKPARLWLKPSTGEWIILDSGKQHRTGLRGECNREPAEKALAAYIAARLPERIGPAQPHEITIGEVLALYVRDCGEDIRGKAVLASNIKALSPFWADRPVDAVKGATCRAYAKQRAKPVTHEYVGKKGGRWTRTYTASPAIVRRELGVLQSALRHAVKEGVLVYAPMVTLPPSNPRRERWLTRSEAARLLKAAPPHVRRFILVALGTGRRATAILQLHWTPSLAGGFADVERGVIEFLGKGQRETKKRRGSCQMTRTLHGHMRRWARDGGSHVIMWNGKPVQSIDKAFSIAAEKAGLEGVTPHTLKHTAVTWAFQRGMSLEDAADWFATTAKTLESVYRQHSPQYQARAKAAMERRA